MRNIIGPSGLLLFTGQYYQLKMTIWNCS